MFIHYRYISVLYLENSTYQVTSFTSSTFFHRKSRSDIAFFSCSCEIAAVCSWGTLFATGVMAVLLKCMNLLFVLPRIQDGACNILPLFSNLTRLRIDKMKQ